MSKLDFAYDPWTDVMTIEGFRYSGALFRDLATGLPSNRWFQVVSRDDGVITIRQHETPEDRHSARVQFEKYHAMQGLLMSISGSSSEFSNEARRILAGQFDARAK